MPYRDVSVVIPTYNGQHLLEQFLPSVVEECEHYALRNRCATEVIVVDDASHDHTIAWLNRIYPGDVRVIAKSKNEGFSPACNAGFREARHPVVLLLNNDIRVMPGAIAPLIEHFDDPTVFAVSCRALRPKTGELDGAGRVGEFVHGFWKIVRNYDVLPVEGSNTLGRLITMTASGGYSAYDRGKFLALGGFEELLAPFYWEDFEICYRAWKRGWISLYEPRSVVYHQTSSTIKTHYEQQTVDVIAHRNRLLSLWINLHDPQMWALHKFVTSLHLISGLIRYDWTFWKAFFQALKHRDRVRVKRHQEKLAAKMTDRELRQLFVDLMHKDNVVMFRTKEEYDDYARRRDALAASTPST